jgi:hypothetical protein
MAVSSGSGGAGQPAAVQAGEPAAAGEELVGWAGLDDAAVLDHRDLVGLGDGGQAVGDDDGRPARAEALEGVGDAGLAGRVQVAGGLVEGEQGRVGDPGPGEGDQLALPGGQQRPPLADLGVVAVGQAGDDLVGPDRAGGRLDLGPGRARAAEADVVQDGAREQEPLLGALVLLRVPERAALGVQVGADPAGLALADAAVSIQHPDQATVRSVAFASPIGVVSLTIAPGRSKVVTHADAGGYPHHLTGHDWARRNRRLLEAEVSTVRRAATV